MEEIVFSLFVGIVMILRVLGDTIVRDLTAG